MNWRVIVAGTVMLGLALAGQAEAQKKRLAMGCTANASSHFAYCVGQANTIDYGLITSDQVYLAHKGESTFKDTPFADIRNLWYYTVSAVYISVREETGIKTIADLTGKKFSPGFRGTATEKMTEATLTHLGIKPEWVRGGASDLVDAIKDKRIVGYAKAADGVRLDASMMDIGTTTPLR